MSCVMNTPYAGAEGQSMQREGRKHFLIFRHDFMKSTKKIDKIWSKSTVKLEMIWKSESPILSKGNSCLDIVNI